MSILDPKNPHLPHFGLQNFPWKSKTVTVTHCLSSGTIKKKTMKRFREKFRNVNFGCKNIPFTLFQAHRMVSTFYQKNSFCQFYRLYWTLASCKKSEKNNEPILRKQCFRGKDGQMNRAEFIRPSSRARGPKKIHK